MQEAFPQEHELPELVDPPDAPLDDVPQLESAASPARPEASPVLSDREQADAIGADLGLTHDQLLGIVDAPSSLFVFGSRNRFRLAMLKTARHPLFRNGVLVLILVNSVLLAVNQPSVTNPRWLDVFLRVSEYVFTAAFTLEALVKIVALGLVMHRGAYLRNGWNVLDLFIVVTSLVQLGGTGGNYSALRVFRVLRPLRSVSRIKQLKHLIAGLFRAMPAMLDNFMLMLFVLIIFAITGLQLFKGKLAQRCYITELTPGSELFNLSAANNHSVSPPLLVANDTELCGGTYKCSPREVYGSPVRCEAHRDIFYTRFLNWDNLYGAFLMALRIMMLEDWPDNLDDLMDTAGAWAALYFVALTMVGSFYVLNLFLGIITDGYSNANEGSEDDDDDDGQEHVVRRRCDAGQQINLDDPGEQALLAFTREALSAALIAKARAAKAAAELTAEAGAASGATPEPRALTPKSDERSEHGGVGTNPLAAEPPALLDADQVQLSQGLRRASSQPQGGALPLTGLQVEGVPVEYFDLPHYTEVFTDNLEFAAKAARKRKRARERALRKAASEASGASSDGEQSRSTGVSASLSTTASSAFYHEDPEGEERHWLRVKVGRVVVSRAFEYAMVAVTLINVIALAIDHWGIDDTVDFVLDTISIVCTALFALEITAKLGAFGWKKTMSDGFNILDLLLVVLSIPDIIISGGDSSSFSAFRVFRLLRVLRLMKGIQSLQVVLKSVIHSMKAVAYLSLLILLYFYIYAILGMQIYGASYAINEEDDVRESFDTLWQALVVCFIVVTGEKWTTIMAHGMSGGTSTEVASVFYFISMYMIGSVVLINLFTAIILDKLSEKMEKINDGDKLTPPALILPSMRQQRFQRAVDAAASRPGSAVDGAGSDAAATPASAKAGKSVQFSIADDAPAPQLPGAPSNADEPALVACTAAQRDEQEAGGGDGKEGGTTDEVASPLEGHFAIELSQRKFIDTLEEEELGARHSTRHALEWLTAVTPMPVRGHSLGIIADTNPVRVALLRAIGSRIFTLAIDALLLANVIFLFFESPFATPGVQRALDAADYVFSIAFTLEMLAKIVALGAVSPAGERASRLSVQDGQPEWVVYPAYFRDPWNVCDAFVTVTALIGLGVPVFRVFRSLRTVRLMLRIESTKKIIIALLRALPNILNGVAMGLIIFIVFGILGVQFFQGKFYECTDPDIDYEIDCVGNFTRTVPGAVPFVTFAETEERRWNRLKFHFDNVGAAMLSLMILSIGEEYMQILYAGLDATHPGGPMRLNNQPWMALYFVIAYVFTNFFTFNMIVGIMINYFSKMKREGEASLLMTAQQEQYIKARAALEEAMFADELSAANTVVSRALEAVLSYRPTLRRRRFKLPLSEYVVMLIVLVNTGFIAATHHEMSDEVARMIGTANLVCVALFSVEALAKMTAYNPLQYFSQAWNVFDFCIVVFGWFDVWFTQLPGLAFLRVLRISKLVRGTSIEKLLHKTYLALPAFVNAILVFVLSLFIYAVIGVHLFGRVKFDDVINANTNFRTVPQAMLLLYVLVTTEWWVEAMEECGVQPPDCDPELDECGNVAISTAFFVTFMLTMSFTVFQLFVAVVIDAFNESAEGVDELALAFREMKKVWAERFGERKRVHYREFIALLPYIPQDLVDLPASPRRADYIRFVSVLALPIDSEQRVSYRDVVYALAWKHYKIDVRTLALVMQKRVLSLMTKSYEVSQVLGAQLIQEYWRAKKRHVVTIPTVPSGSNLEAADR